VFLKYHVVAKLRINCTLFTLVIACIRVVALVHQRTVIVTLCDACVIFR